MRQKLRRHADAVVGDHKFVFGVLPAVQLGDVQCDAAVFLGELEGVGEKVVENLLEPEGVRQQMGVFQGEVPCQLLALLLRLVAEGLQTLLHAGLQVDGAVVQRDHALLHAGHVQNVVDQFQQLAAGAVDPAEILGDLRGAVRVLAGQLGKADDGIEGSAHVVGHAAEKGLLGRLVLAGDLQGVLQ